MPTRAPATIADIVEWKMNPCQAVDLQRQLASLVEETDDPSLEEARILVAFDISAHRFCRKLYAAAAVWDIKKRRPLQVLRAKTTARFPYIPGLLSFREMPAMLEVFGKLVEVPHLLLCDAHGLMHPRRFGLACHIGVVTGIPTIGCAKSPLIGNHGQPGPEKGCCSQVMVEGKRAGYVVRSRSGSKPLYISPGHEITCETAVEIVLSLLDRSRIPPPLQVAHREALSFMRENENK